MRTNKRWSETEKEYLKENYGKIHSLQIAKNLNRTQKQVITQAVYLKLQKPKGQSKIRLISDVEILLKTCGPKLISDYKGITKNAKFRCEFCNMIFITTPERVITKHTKSCGCVSIGKRKGSENISHTLFSHIMRGAKSRNITFDVSLDFLEKLLKQQQFKCALSGRLLKCGYSSLQDCTLSLDRIDSSIGYTENNVQWVHKNVNLAKQSMSNQEFIKMCIDIYRNQYDKHPYSN